MVGAKSVWKYGLEEWIGREFSGEELLDKLNNVGFMGFVYNFVFLVSHSKNRGGS